MSSQVTINKMAGDVKEAETLAAGDASRILQLQGEVAARQAEVESIQVEWAQREDSWREQRMVLEAENERLAKKLNDSVRWDSVYVCPIRAKKRR